MDAKYKAIEVVMKSMILNVTLTYRKEEVIKTLFGDTLYMHIKI